MRAQVTSTPTCVTHSRVVPVTSTTDPRPPWDAANPDNFLCGQASSSRLIPTIISWAPFAQPPGPCGVHQPARRTPHAPFHWRAFDDAPPVQRSCCGLGHGRCFIRFVHTRCSAVRDGGGRTMDSHCHDEPSLLGVPWHRHHIHGERHVEHDQVGPRRPRGVQRQSGTYVLPSVGQPVLHRRHAAYVHNSLLDGARRRGCSTPTTS